MASASYQAGPSAPPGQLLLACVARHGSAGHAYGRSEALLKSAHSARNLADLIHFLCILHGRYPGVVDHAADRVAEPGARRWLAAAAHAFAGERAFLARLAVAAGPVPSTPGAADSDAAALGQRHAIEMLAQSERNGCALGAAMAVVLDWSFVRGALDIASVRFGVEPPPWPLADPNRIVAVADAFATGTGPQRALMFGAEQVLLQHYGLWDLLEARAQARAAG